MNYFENKVCPYNCNADCNECDKITKERKALEIIKELFDFSLEFDESQNEWFLYISNEEQGILFAKGTGKKTYNLLKEVLL